MAKEKEFKKQDENLENVGEALNTTGQWIEEHSNMLTWILIVIVAVVLGIMAVINYVIKPKTIEAGEEIARAVVYFQAGDWTKALNGDEEDCLGFEAIANDYKMYQAGELAAAYAGICSYKLGDYESAADFLNRFSADDKMVSPAVLQMLGDTYVQLDELDKAAKAFYRAAESGNEWIAPMSLKKLGFVEMERGNKEAAVKAFTTIKTGYPTSQEAQDADKYIELNK